MKYSHFGVWLISYNCLHDKINDSFIFDRNKISFRVIKCHINTIRIEIIQKETSAHAVISSKQK